ncbi:MAG: PQQ-dependent sugar dehydrogenase [Hyphomicrobiaceae bacterium]
MQRLFMAFLGLGVWIAAVAIANAAQTRAPDVDDAVPVRTEVIASGLQNPWGLAFLHDDRMLVTERPGRLRIIGADGAISRPVDGLPVIRANGQGGLLDVAVGPDFANDRLVYITYSEPRDRGEAVAAGRGRLVEEGDGARLEDFKVIFRQQPAVASAYHFGSRIVFRGDGTLFVTLGDRGRPDNAQDPLNHWAKVVRVTVDGTVPADNPFVGRSDALPEIWSMGHRNVQGAALHPETGELWTVEHGARGGDEINIARAGLNYGWPVISYGVQYSGGKIGIGTHAEGMEQPLYYWDPSIAPSGMTFYTSPEIPEWTGSIFVGALRGQHLARLVVRDGSIVGEERLLDGLGARIRDVRQGPDGALYLLTDSGNGRLIRVTARRN